MLQQRTVTELIFGGRNQPFTTPLPCLSAVLKNLSYVFLYCGVTTHAPGSSFTVAAGGVVALIGLEATVGGAWGLVTLGAIGGGDLGVGMAWTCSCAGVCAGVGVGVGAGAAVLTGDVVSDTEQKQGSRNNPMQQSAQ